MNDGPILDVLCQTTGAERKAGMMFDFYLSLFYRSASEEIRIRILDWLCQVQLYALREIFARELFEFVDYREDRDLAWNHQHRLELIFQEKGEVRRELYLVSRSREMIDSLDMRRSRAQGRQGASQKGSWQQ